MTTIRQETFDYLCKGGSICFRSICKYCYGASVSYVSDDVKTYVEEVKYFASNNKEYILDIGGINEKGVVVFGIIFRNNTDEIDKVFIWPQIDIKDITHKLKSYEELIFLNNLSTNGCDNKICPTKN